VYTAYLGGSRAPMVAGWSDEEVAAVAIREFRDVTGVSARAIHVGREWMPAWDRSWAASANLDLPSGLHIAANWRSRPGIPGRLAEAARLAERLAARR
jgi:protoporphyrinogen/coproporphyrinogen III oxidase